MLRNEQPIALPPVLLVDYDDVEGIDCDQSPADVAIFNIPYKCAVVEAGAFVLEACAGADSTPVVAFDLRPTAMSDTDRGAADIASLALATSAPGAVMYDRVAVGTVLEPGNQVVVQLVTAAVGVGKTGHFLPYLLVEYLPEVKGNLDNMVETA